MKSLIKDIRFALRSLRKRPGLSALVVLMLALGIGANSAVFSVIDGVLLRPLPYPEPEGLVFVWNDFPGSGQGELPVSPRELLDWQNETAILEDVAGINTGEQMALWTLTENDETEVHAGAFVTANFFEVLRVPAALGRTFTPEEGTEGADAVIVLSDGFWRNRFGADPAIVGRTLTIRGKGRQVVGVMPPGFQTDLNVTDARAADFWVPMVIQLDVPREARFFNAVGRLKPGISIERANAHAATVARSFEEAYPEAYAEDSDYSVRIESLRDRIVGDVHTSLLVLLGTVALVLLIACLNVANLLLVRAESRQREIAIRTALGASRAGILRLFAAESLALTALGGLAGLLVGYAGIEFFQAFNPGDIPRVDLVAMNAPALGFTVLLSILTGGFVGLVPGWHASRTNINATLRDGGRGSTGGTARQGLRHALVTVEMSLAVVLVVGAGLLLRSFRELSSIDLGIVPERVLSMRLDYPDWQYPETERVSDMNRLIAERVGALEGVRSASLAHADHPLRLNGRWYFRVDGRPIDPDASKPLVGIRVVTPSHFETLGIPVLAGRLFDELDRDPDHPVILINRAMAEKWFPDEDPIGNVLRVWGDFDERPYEIIGVVGDVKNEGIREPVRETILLPRFNAGFASEWQRHMTLHVRTAGDPTALAGSVRAAISDLDPTLSVRDVQPLGDVVAGTVAGPRFVSWLVGLFAGLALLLAAVGIYGVISYSVARRVPEIGVRMALGAGPGSVVKLILGQGFSLVFAGVGAGVLAALGLTRLLRSLLYGVSATDPVTFLAVTLLLAFVALFATALPAWRASRIEPVAALRHE